MTTETITQDSPCSLAIAQIEGSRDFVLKLIDTLSDYQLLTRVDGFGNHTLWIMGHLAFGEDLFVSEFRDEPSCLPAGHAELFGAGSEPQNSATAYPPRQEMSDRLTTARKRLITWAETLEGEAAWQPAPESLVHLAPNAVSSVHTLAQHDFFHAGQIATIRASLGMKPLFM